MLFMGKSTISMVIFHSYVKLPEGNWYLDEVEKMPESAVVRGMVLLGSHPEMAGHFSAHELQVKKWQQNAT